MPQTSYISTFFCCYLNQVYQLTVYQDEDSDADSFDEDPEISLAVSKTLTGKAS